MDKDKSYEKFIRNPAPGVHLKNRSYHYVRYQMDPATGEKKRKWSWLAKTVEEAIARYTKIKEKKQTPKVKDAILRYLGEVASKKAPATYKGNIREARHLIKFFGEMYPEDVERIHCYQYLEDRQAKVRANREMSMMIHCMEFWVKWGYIKKNPALELQKNPETPRDRTVTDEEYQAVYDCGAPIVKMVMEFALLAGQRISDCLKVKKEDVLIDGVYVEISKVKNKIKSRAKILITWNQDFFECVYRIMKVCRYNSPYLFHDAHGHHYVYERFRHWWDKARAESIKKGTLKQSFRFNDLRAKSATDDKDLDRASNRLGHQNKKTTMRHYIRKPRKVSPLKR